MDNELVIENRILLYDKPEGDFVVPDEVTYITGSGIGEIPDYTSKLTSITIPKSVNGISKNAFMDMYSLASINVATDNQAFTSINGVLFNKKKPSSSLTRAQKKPQITLFPTA